MKITILFTLLGISFTTLQGQDEGNRSEDENPFDAYLKLAPKAAEVSAAQKAKAAENLKNVLIPEFESQAKNPSLRFTTESGHELVSFSSPEFADRMEGLLKELRVSLMPSEETESEDWVKIETAELGKRGWKAVILFPDFPSDVKLPFYGIRLYDKQGNIAEFSFASQKDAPTWTKLIKELQVIAAKRQVKEPSPTGGNKPND